MILACFYAVCAILNFLFAYLDFFKPTSDVDGLLGVMNILVGLLSIHWMYAEIERAHS
jgi:hypothetical protein